MTCSARRRACAQFSRVRPLVKKPTIFRQWVLNMVAPRPGLEPGTYGLTGWPTRADAVCKAKIGKAVLGGLMAGACGPNLFRTFMVNRPTGLRKTRTRSTSCRTLSPNWDRALMPVVTAGPALCNALPIGNTALLHLADHLRRSVVDVGGKRAKHWRPQAPHWMPPVDFCR